MTQRSNHRPTAPSTTADAAVAAIAGTAPRLSTLRATAIATITTTGTGTSRPGCDRA